MNDLDRRLNEHTDQREAPDWCCPECGTGVCNWSDDTDEDGKFTQLPCDDCKAKTECRACGEDHLRPQDLSAKGFCQDCQTNWPHDCDDCYELEDGHPCRKHEHLYEPDGEREHKEEGL